MDECKAQLIEIWQAPEGNGGRIRVDHPFDFVPGQYMLVRSASDLSSLPMVVFPSSKADNGLITAASLPIDWIPGEHLSLSGPLGHGFRLPASARFLGMAAPEGDPSHLMPLIDAGIRQGAAVSLFLGKLTERTSLFPLPAVVEVQPLSALPEALVWADFLAVDIPLRSLSNLSELLGLKGGDQKLPCPGQALVRTDMPCAGIADCGVCALKTRSGWRLACKNGPVFDLEELLDVA
ncbi:MAG: hypothetical protein ABIG43_02115 [Chloroflexota bacterium]